MGNEGYRLRLASNSPEARSRTSRLEERLGMLLQYLCVPEISHRSTTGDDELSDLDCGQLVHAFAMQSVGQMVYALMAVTIVQKCAVKQVTLFRGQVPG